ncbi:hypothetical protein R1flu_006254 [Riccia fluitans]|uniref:Retrovirus-related Pol polyprotein from transposon TNT 1-94-like beta-barrel domain-containing protein n=1 Tax=Riccia fluitans TaxID=41844 RepID=A0ABD1YVH9_9MARC
MNFVKEVSLVSKAGPIQIKEEHPPNCNLAEEKRTFTVDSGYTSTMVGSVDLLCDVKKTVGKVKLGGAANEILVAGMGNFPLPLISGKVQNIPDALLVSDLRKDLLLVRKLVQGKLVTGLDIAKIAIGFYETCVLDKHARGSFSLPATRAFELLELVHTLTDLYGLVKVLGIRDHYFL